MTMIKVAGFLLDGIPLKDVTPSETVIGTALADSKPIEGTDLHEVMVEIVAPGMTVGAFPCMKCQWKRCGVRGEVCSECRDLKPTQTKPWPYVKIEIGGVVGETNVTFWNCAAETCGFFCFAVGDRAVSVAIASGDTHAVIGANVRAAVDANEAKRTRKTLAGGSGRLQSLQEIRPGERFALPRGEVTVDTITYGSAPSVTVATTSIDGSPSRENVSAAWFLENARRVETMGEHWEALAKQMTDYMAGHASNPFGYVIKDFPGLKQHVTGADLLVKQKVTDETREALLADHVRRREVHDAMRSLVLGFEMLWRAMNSKRGCRMLNEQLVRGTLALCPRDLDRRGFAVCFIADFERNGQFDPMVRDAWKHLKPAQYAVDMAMMVRNQVTEVGWKGPNKNPMVGIYERAMKQPEKTEGPWRYRGKR